MVRDMRLQMDLRCAFNSHTAEPLTIFKDRVWAPSRIRIIGPPDLFPRHGFAARCFDD
jgi:hypothetical protein